MKIDIIVDLQLGDTGKGKVTHHLLKSGKYSHCIRYNGSSNAGHTIYHEGKKFVTHAVPAGVFFNIPSIIGSGCVVNPDTLLQEIEELENLGVPASSYVKVAHNTHIIQAKHLEEDVKDTKIGTTRKGNGPAFRDKYARTGIRAEDCDLLKPYVIDVYSALHTTAWPEPFVLMEGAQGFYLDPDHGEYPYVTSSHCTVAAALQNGFSYKDIRKVFGTAKAYETYSGFKNFQPSDPIFDKIGDAGNEFGATTGRRRQVNWIDLDELLKAALLNGVTDLIISKVDVLQEVGAWGLRGIGVVPNESTFRKAVEYSLPKEIDIIWSGRPDGI